MAAAWNRNYSGQSWQVGRDCRPDSAVTLCDHQSHKPPITIRNVLLQNQNILCVRVQQWEREREREREDCSSGMVGRWTRKGLKHHKWCVTPSACGSYKSVHPSPFLDIYQCKKKYSLCHKILEYWFIILFWDFKKYLSISKKIYAFFLFFIFCNILTKIKVKNND